MNGVDRKVLCNVLATLGDKTNEAQAINALTKWSGRRLDELLLMKYENFREILRAPDSFSNSLSFFERMFADTDERALFDFVHKRLVEKARKAEFCFIEFGNEVNRQLAALLIDRTEYISRPLLWRMDSDELATTAVFCWRERSDVSLSEILRALSKRKDGFLTADLAPRLALIKESSTEEPVIGFSYDKRALIARSGSEERWYLLWEELLRVGAKLVLKEKEG
jgi:hypothetical protein